MFHWFKVSIANAAFVWTINNHNMLSQRHIHLSALCEMCSQRRESRCHLFALLFERVKKKMYRKKKLKNINVKAEKCV